MNTSVQDWCLSPGMILGKNYQIIKEIGKGGMGMVYMAYDTSLDIRVAVKLVSPELPKNMEKARAENILKRFRSEARLAAKIDHPNVIRIFGFKQDRIEINGEMHDLDYLVMELLAERTLRNTMDVSGFEYEEEIREWIADYLIPILNGIQKVHECGIIHRDIKPENFLIKDNTPKLADFGLSLGFDFPAITETIADVYGTVTYMAPEQFYNFSMAREPSDIYSIGKILFEAVAGKISEKTNVFKQVRLSEQSTGFLQELNSIIMAATAENPNERIASAAEMKERLMRLLNDDILLPHQEPDRKPFYLKRYVIFPVILVAALTAGAVIMHFMHEPSLTPQDIKTEQAIPGGLKKIIPLSYPEDAENIIRSKNGAILHLIPPAELILSSHSVLKKQQVKIDPFYISESPVTNHQYVIFLNENIEKITIKDSDVYLDDRLILKISEKIRGYKPINFKNGRFDVREAMHAACAVLMVTGFGAQAYADYYGLRLPGAREWYYLMKTDDAANSQKPALPAPVLSYPKNKYGLRGISQLAEWGGTENGNYVIMGDKPSKMLEDNMIIEKNPEKYFTDTGFRVAESFRNP